MNCDPKDSPDYDTYIRIRCYEKINESELVVSKIIKLIIDLDKLKFFCGSHLNLKF